MLYNCSAPARPIGRAGAEQLCSSLGAKNCYTIARRLLDPSGPSKCPAALGPNLFDTCSAPLVGQAPGRCRAAVGPKVLGSCSAPVRLIGWASAEQALSSITALVKPSEVARSVFAGNFKCRVCPVGKAILDDHVLPWVIVLSQKKNVVQGKVRSRASPVQPVPVLHTKRSTTANPSHVDSTCQDLERP